ncbi:helix-turn-helix transcriptional regulator [Salinarimonas sp.]|uniref:helix-turn-helix transcriptional regulator n=1 Tax=Salinarimonas sp. TaxID=2766526 RepID=UPI0032D93FCB
MTTAELAAYLRLKERTVYEMAGKGQLPCTRATGKLLFSRRLVDRWLEAHTELPAQGIAPPPPIYAGSSDPLLEWALRASGSGLAVLASGSQDGLERFARGEAVMAGVHILEPESGAYNIDAVRRTAPFPDVVAIRFCTREQGLIVRAGNPLELARVADCVARGARLALRPEGAGSRILLETLLAREGVALEALPHVDRIAQTQEDLAALIAAGEADVGLGVAAAAQVTGLAFVPLEIVEPFDLVMRRRDYFEPAVQALVAFLGTATFADRARALGYRAGETGRVVYNA